MSCHHLLQPYWKQKPKSRYYSEVICKVNYKVRLFLKDKKANILRDIIKQTLFRAPGWPTRLSLISTQVMIPRVCEIKPCISALTVQNMLRTLSLCPTPTHMPTLSLSLSLNTKIKNNEKKCFPNIRNFN